MPELEEYWSAIKDGNRSALDAMLAAEPDLVHKKTEDGLTAPILAMYYNEPEIAAALIQLGAEVDIFTASATGRELDARALLVSDPSRANQQAVDGFTPLGLAAFFGHPAVVETLLRLGAHVNQPAANDVAAYPLHSAAAARQIGIARVLLDAGAEVDARENGGFTALHIAAQNGQFELVNLLLERGANPDVVTDEGKTARDLAEQYGHRQVADRLGR